MSDFKNSEQQLDQIDSFIDNYQQHPNMLQVRILKLKLKEEKQRDKIVYQSIKEKIITR